MATLGKRPRQRGEVCDYCYIERKNKGALARDRISLEGVICVCSTSQGCRSMNCLYGISIGGTGGTTEGTRKSHQPSN